MILLRRALKPGEFTLSITRRSFVQRGSLAAMAMAMGRGAAQKPVPKFRTEFNVNSLAQFVDPLPIPEIAKSSGLRASPTDASVKIPYFVLRCGSLKRRSTAIEANAALGDMAGLRQARHLNRAAGRDCWWSGQTNCRPHIFCRSTNYSWRGADKPEVRTVVHLHGGKIPPRATAIRRTGVYRGSRRSITIRTTRKRRCCGITTTLLALIA